MALHIREQIAAALKTKFAAAGMTVNSVAVNVYRGRVSSVPVAKLPAICLFIAPDPETNEAQLGSETAPYENKCVLVIEGKVGVKPTDVTDSQLETRLNELDAALQPVISANHPAASGSGLNGLAMDFRRTATQLEIPDDQAGEQYFGRLYVSCEILYRTRGDDFTEIG